METSQIIIKVIEELTKDIPYCGSCMGGCDNVTKFICLGGNIDSINKYLEDNPTKVDEWEAELYADL